jgi:transposase
LVAYAGLDATVKASGQFEGTRNRISKRGSPTLRNSLWLAAVTARRFNPELKAFYEAKRAQGKHSGVATGAVARRLVHLIYSIWKDNRPFEPDYKWVRLVVIINQNPYVIVKERVKTYSLLFIARLYRMQFD